MDTCPYGSEEWVCQLGDPCFRCADDEHELLHLSGQLSEDECPTCKLRSVQLNPRTVTPSSRNQIAPRRPNNSWEKGEALDHRGIPYLDMQGNPIPVKKFAEKRSKYEEGIRLAKSGRPVSIHER